MRNYLSLLLLCLLFFICLNAATGSLWATDHQIDLPVTPEVAIPGNPLSLEYEIHPGESAGNADLYVGLLPPGGSLFFVLPWGFTTKQYPYASNLSLTTDMYGAILSGLVLPSALPGGDYTFASLLTEAGSDLFATDSLISKVAVSIMQFKPLSPAQEAFIDAVGYPDLFVKTFDEENGEFRIDETWVYREQGLTEYFVNGIFMKEEVHDTSDLSTSPPQYHPEDYRFDTTPQMLQLTHGEPLEILKDSTSNEGFFAQFLADAYYVYDGILFGFRSGRLVSAVTNPE